MRVRFERRESRVSSRRSGSGRDVTVTLTLQEWIQIGEALKGLAAIEPDEYQAKIDAVDLLDTAVSRAAGFGFDSRWI